MTSNKRISYHENSDPWAIMIALACIIIVATGAAIAVICILWKRYEKRRLLYEQSLIQLQNKQQQQPQYEVQGVDMFVPNEEGEDLGEVHVEFSPREGIQSIQHVRELPEQVIRPEPVFMANRAQR